MDNESPSISGLEVKRRLAIGGMAELFVAVRASDDREIVIKTLLPGSEPLVHELFRRETEVLGLLRSPHVVRLEGEGDGYMLLEYVEGADLAAIFTHLKKRGRRLSKGALLALLTGVCRGLVAIHGAKDADGVELNIVHRDINPSNILVSATGEVKIADLGIVHVPGRGTSGGVKGTLASMAPEQFSAATVDQRTDIHALGLIAYEALTGLPALPPGTLGVSELVEARAKLPTAPSVLQPDVSPALDAAVLWALEPAPSARPQTVTDWLRRVEEAIGEAEVTTELGGLASEVSSPVKRAAQTVAPLQPYEAVGATSSIISGTSWLLPVVTLLLLLTGSYAVYQSMFSGDSDLQTAQDTMAGKTPPDVADVAAQRSVADTAEVEIAADTAPEADLIDTDSVNVFDGSRPELRRPNDTKVVQPSSVRVLISSGDGGPLYVKGPGVSGVRAKRSAPLSEGAHVFRLTGGEPTIAATVRLTIRGESIRVRIPKPSDSFFEVQCGGSPRRMAPTGAMKVRDSLSCQIFAPEGHRMAFKLRLYR